MLWLGVDFETTGLEKNKDRITEVGAVLWDVRNKKPVRIYNELVYDFEQGVPNVSEKITQLTGITAEMLEGHGIDTRAAISDLNEMAEKATHFMAHNAPFDNGFYEEECKRLGMERVVMPWIDTITDVPYETEGSLSLSYLAADHGFLNPFSHRAVFDVLTMCKVISNYDADQIIQWQASPTVTIRALVDFANKEKAKTLSYKWNAEKKHWLKNVKEFRLDEEMKTAKETGFDVELIHGS